MIKRTIITIGSYILAYLLFSLPSQSFGQTHCCCPNCPNMGSGYECIPNDFGTCGASCAIICGDPTGFMNSNDPACADITCAPLPIELEYFKAVRTTEGVELRWRTASEKDNQGFEIIRAGGIEMNWELIGFVSGQGNSEEENFYAYLDRTPPPGTHYYRLRQLDFDGLTTLSQVVAASGSDASSFELWPTVAKSHIVVSAQKSIEQDYDLQVFDMVGKKVLESTFTDATSINISNLPKGNYIMNIVGDNETHLLRFVKAE